MNEDTPTTLAPSEPVAVPVQRPVRPSLDDLMTDLAVFVFYRDLDKIEPAREAIRAHVEHEVAAERARAASCVPMLGSPSLKARIRAAIEHAEAHGQMRDALWPHQHFALTIGELLLAAERGA